MNKEQFDAAVKYVKAGGSIKAIQNKYKLTAKQEKELNENMCECGDYIKYEANRLINLCEECC